MRVFTLVCVGQGGIVARGPIAGTGPRMFPVNVVQVNDDESANSCLSLDDNKRFTIFKLASPLHASGLISKLWKRLQVLSHRKRCAAGFVPKAAGETPCSTTSCL